MHVMIKIEIMSRVIFYYQFIFYKVKHRSFTGTEK